MISTKDQINRVKIYAKALSFLGTDASPADQAPDDYGCADSVSGVLFACFGPILKWSVSTAELYNLLNSSPHFIKTKEFRPGDIIISPTGQNSNPAVMPNGHVGIFGEGEEIMSNSSANGLWTNNYTLTSWVARYRTQGGYPIYYFRKL
jgi:hypothetical protein